MAFLEKRPAIIGGVVFGAVIVIVCGYIFWDLRVKLPKYALPPLPAEQTLLVFSGMDNDAWRRVIPVLQGLPDLPSPPPQHGAVLDLPSGRTWVTLTPGSRDLGEVSQDVRTALTDVKHPLNDSPVLSRMMGTPAWLLIKHDLLSLPQLRDAPPLLGIRLTQSGASVLWEGPPVTLGVATMLMQEEHDITHVFVRSPSALFGRMAALLPDERAVVTKALLETFVSDLLGDAVSPREEVFPLFASALSVQRGGSGTVLAHGMSADALPTDATLKRLHDALAASNTPVERITAETKEGFTVDTLRQSTKAPDTMTSKKNGWTLRVTRADDRTLLASATRGTEVLMGNDADAVELAVDRTAPAPADTLAIGSLPRESLSPLVTRLLPEIPLYKLLSILQESSSDGVFWALKEQSGLWSLEVQTALDSPAVSR